MSIYLGNKKLAGVSVKQSHNIGDIFFTKRTDTVLAGAVECNGATYQTTDYTGAGSIGELLEAGKLDYISLTAYATAISTKGWCDKIGWDGTGTTSFRVPTLTPHIIQKNNIPVVGTGKALGFTNGTNTYGSVYNTGSPTHLDARADAYDANNGASYSGSGVGANKVIGITTDGTKSGIIADTSDTAQERVMIQLYNAVTDEALATCDSVLSDVADLKYDYVVAFQRPTAANNYTWYRKYKSGWVEQGGTYTSTASGTQTIAFPIEMLDTNYSYFNALHYNSDAGIACRTAGYTPTKTGFTVYHTSSGRNYSWQVSGMAA